MARRDRKLLRPEDATSWEEFQARCTVEQAQCRAVNSSNKSIGQALLAGLFAFGAILFWGGMTFAQGTGKWPLLVLALIFTWLFVRYFSRGIRRGFGGSKRYMQLTRLSKEWQARAERGEIPQTTPGGSKVWQDELEPKGA
jgi:hypothetical protein